MMVQWGDQDPNTAWVTDEYEQMSNVHVNWISIPQDGWKDKVAISFAGGDLPDVIAGMDGYNLSATDELQYASQGLLLPLNDVIDRSSVEFKGTKGYEAVARDVSFSIPSLSVPADKISDHARIKTEIGSYSKDFMVKFITGKLSLDADWDVYIDQLDRIGLEEYMTPSTSPENKFFLPGTSAQDHPDQVKAGNRMSPNRPDTAEVAKAATMDIAIIRELLRNLKRAAAILGRTDPLLERVDEVLENLMPFKIGKHGQLQEWDGDYDACTPGMSHMSHLYPVLFSRLIRMPFISA